MEMKSTEDLKLEIKGKIKKYFKKDHFSLEDIPESKIKGYFVLMGYDIKEVDLAWGNAVNELVNEFAQLLGF